MKVGLAGLYSNQNIGDYLLVECTQHLIRSCDDTVVIRLIDVDPREENVFRGRRRVQRKISRLMTSYQSLVFSFVKNPYLQYLYGYFNWWIRLNWWYRESLLDIDALIIAGGGFIKYKTQGLNYIDEQLIKIAEESGIPIMFNAVGIEGYDEVDARCQSLKRAINSECVRMITTRDDIETLRDKYISNPKTITALAGDPVLWLEECFSIKRCRESKVIGVNLINPNNFKAYGGRLSYFEIENFYRSLIQELELRDADYRLFTNGMQVDFDFGKKLVLDMNVDDRRLVNRPDSSKELLQTVSRFGVVLAARMHAGIIAYAMDIPVVGIIWSEKVEHFARVAGVRDHYFSEEELVAVDVCDQILSRVSSEVSNSRRLELREKTASNLKLFLSSNFL